MRKTMEITAVIPNLLLTVHPNGSQFSKAIPAIYYKQQ
jgi:hypothetical protein